MMHMATTLLNSDCEAWLAANSAYCHRHHARISEPICREQQKKSVAETGDSRCKGCNGLHDQQPVAPRLHLVSSAIVSDVSEMPVPGKAEEHAGFDLDNQTMEIDLSGLSFDVSEEMATRILEQDPELGRELLILLNDDREEEPIDPEEQSAIVRRFRQPQQLRQVAVYTGRCRRCGQYMTNDLERHDGIRDDAVYRCFTCGWRTSPGYEFNRNNPGMARTWER